MHFFRIRLVAALLVGITLISVGSTYFDVLAHKHMLRSDLARRMQWLGAGLQPQVEQQMALDHPEVLPQFLTRLRQYPDQPGLAVYDTNGTILAETGNVLALRNLPVNFLKRPIIEGKEATAFVRVPDTQATGSEANSTGRTPAQPGAAARLWYEDAIPLHNGQRTVGALVMVADAEYIRRDGVDVWRRSFFNIAAMVVLVAVVTLLMVRWFLLQPVTRAAEWLRRLRQGKAEVSDGAKEFGFLIPLANEVTSLAEHLTRARAAAETEAQLRDAGEHVWTAHRLAVHVRERLGNGKLFAVSNREPYIHVRQGSAIECVVPPSGLVTALEPVLQACDGTWIAHGSGNEDAAFVDAYDRLRVPPDDPRYTLRRVWLSPEEEAGYYEGFANEGIWPLCHIAHTRPIFRTNDWDYYQRVNAKFAEVLIEEMRETEHPIVFIQDYHFALLPRLVKMARPDARVAIFWHIPWPNAEAFGICPWQAELLDGLLGADVIGFHIQSHCNNFLDTVDRVLEARTDREHFSIRRHGHVSLVRPFPISVAWDEHSIDTPNSVEERFNGTVRPSSETSAEQEQSKNIDNTATELHRELGIEGKQLIVGVDRMDYTKGIVERLLAFEHLLEEHPWYIEKVVFAQIAAPSRTHIPSYAALRVQVQETVERINRRFEKSGWSPVILIERQCSHEEVSRYYRAAGICLVTSLHDGMNLVAKEYLAARRDSDGVLILSRFTGAAQELRDALLVNPYDIRQVAEAIRTGLEMSPGERRLRMERMRLQVKEHNVYRWASNVLTDVCAVRIEDEVLAHGSRT
ncbi:alpha,alpha-trehalose-phosphate synthase (UDP-forming) [Acidicapsa acidisoli]|uniref:alpha,alpha-trehalose-phosphate synthase (UDP-forming) n=1 Tax=Acidicapsa acidisoli TaxID=1615681 RepID=UPI0021E06658|nr:trehalose-6-phosphate synthase [Acidicapsa acidisoli]